MPFFHENCKVVSPEIINLIEINRKNTKLKQNTENLCCFCFVDAVIVERISLNLVTLHAF